MYFAKIVILSILLLLFFVGCARIITDMSDTVIRSVQEGIEFIDMTYGAKGWMTLALVIILAGVATATTHETIYLIGAIVISFMTFFFFGLVRL